MKTSVIEVHDMLSVFSVDEVEKRIGAVPGVESVTVNYAAGSATARYDETRLEVADIKSAVRQRGYESAAPAASAGGGHEGHTAPGAPPATPAPAASKIAPVASATAGGASAGTAQQDKGAPSPTSNPAPAESVAAHASAPASSKSARDVAPAGDEHHDKAGKS
jgi:copper chaperone CopZ